MQLSPLLFALIVKSWCLSDREFPKFFKTPLTFNPGVNLKAVIANQSQATSFALVGCTPAFLNVHRIYTKYFEWTPNLQRAS